MTGSVKDDGGLAFGGNRIDPVKMADGSISNATVAYPGMSLRDWFAGQALNALIQRGHDKAAAVEYAYTTADAMLAERSKP